MLPRILQRSLEDFRTIVEVIELLEIENPKVFFIDPHFEGCEPDHRVIALRQESWRTYLASKVNSVLLRHCKELGGGANYPTKLILDIIFDVLKFFSEDSKSYFAESFCEIDHLHEEFDCQSGTWEVKNRFTDLLSCLRTNLVDKPKCASEQEGWPCMGQHISYEDLLPTDLSSERFSQIETTAWVNAALIDFPDRLECFGLFAEGVPQFNFFTTFIPEGSVATNSAKPPNKKSERNLRYFKANSEAIPAFEKWIKTIDGANSTSAVKDFMKIFGNDIYRRYDIDPTLKPRSFETFFSEQYRKKFLNKLSIEKKKSRR